MKYSTGCAMQVINICQIIFIIALVVAGYMLLKGML